MNSIKSLFLTALLAFAVVGCAHTGISRGPDDCGRFESSVFGIPPFYTPAGQYETYAQACGVERFSRVIAEQRTAVVRAAYAAAAGGGRDEVARRENRRTRRAVRDLAHAVERIAADHGGEGGAQ